MVTRSLRDAQRLDLGFDRRSLAQLTADWQATPPARCLAEAQDLVRLVRTVPGVLAASVSHPAAFGRRTEDTFVYAVAGDQAAHRTEVVSADSAFFATVRIPL